VVRMRVDLPPVTESRMIAVPPQPAQGGTRRAATFGALLIKIRARAPIFLPVSAPARPRSQVLELLDRLRVCDGAQSGQVAVASATSSLTAKT
jgi:hypothetical protein